eukprot:3660851-Pyramimonas_sp.AAC.1
MWLGGVLPSRPAVITTSLAKRQIEMLSRSRFLRLTIIHTSKSMRRPGWTLTTLPGPSVAGVTGAAWQLDLGHFRDIDPCCAS